MKTAVIYASRYGMTEKLANIMVRHRTDVHLFHIKDFANNIDSYDEFIIGTPIYAGQINKKIKKFINSSQNKLLDKKLRIFLSGMAHDQEQTVIEQNFDEAIIKHATIKYVGGAYQFEKMNFFFKMIVKKIANTNQNQEILLDQNIQELLE